MLTPASNTFSDTVSILPTITHKFQLLNKDININGKSLFRRIFKNRLSLVRNLFGNREI